MICELQPKQLNNLLLKVYRNLETFSKSKDPFSLEDYVKDVYNKVLDRYDNEALALAYAQQIPDTILLALTGKKLMKKALRESNDNFSNALDDMAENFEDLNYVKSIVSPVKINIKDINDTKRSIIEEQKKPTVPEPLSPEELQKSADDTKYMFKPSTALAVVGQQGIIIPHPTKDEHTNEKNPEEDFYYDFFDVIAKAMRNQGKDASDVTIGGNTGFKLKVQRKTHIRYIEDARPSDQRLVNGQETELIWVDENNKSKGKHRVKIDYLSGQRRFHGAPAAFVTDINGNVLFFDEDYNTVSEGDGKPIYHNLRAVKKNLKTGVYSTESEDSLQNSEEVARKLFRPIAGSTINTFEKLKKGDENLYNELVDKAFKMRQAQLEQVFLIKQHLSVKIKGQKNNTVILNIDDINRGVLDISLGTDTPSNSINWDKSEVPFLPRIHLSISETATDEKKSGMYISIPGGRSLPLQENNFTNDTAQSIVDLLFDDLKNNRGREVLPSVREALIKSFVYVHPKSIQVFNNEDTGYTVMFKGSSIDLTDPAAVAKAKEDIIKHLTTKAINKNGDVTKYNTNDGKYKFDNNLFGKDYDTFTIEDGVLKITPVQYVDFVKANTAVKVKVTNDKIVFLNGYFTFSLTADAFINIGANAGAKTVITPDDKRESKGVKPNVDFDNPAISINDLARIQAAKIKDLDIATLLTNGLVSTKGLKQKEVEGAEVFTKQIFAPKESKQVFEFIEKLYSTYDSEHKSSDKFGRGRRSMYFSDESYSYSGTTRPANLGSADLQRLISKITTDLGFEEGYFDMVLINEYKDGSQKIGFHTDNEPILNNKGKLNPSVVTISFGDERTMILATPKTKGTDIKYKIPMTSGLALIMGKNGQTNYEHGIDAEGNKSKRFSVTLRHNAEKSQKIDRVQATIEDTVPLTKEQHAEARRLETTLTSNPKGIHKVETKKDRYYEDAQGNRYIGLSGIVNPSDFVDTEGLWTGASPIGTAVDGILRDFYAGNEPTYTKAIAKRLSEEAFTELLTTAEKFKDNYRDSNGSLDDIVFLTEGLFLATKDVQATEKHIKVKKDKKGKVISGSISSKEGLTHSYGIATELDMVVLNKRTGEAHLVDFKTVRVDPAKNQTVTKKLVSRYVDKTGNQKPSKKDGYSKQQNASRQIVELNEGIDFKTMSLLAAEVQYPEGGQSTTKAEVMATPVALEKETIDKVFPKEYADQLTGKAEEDDILGTNTEESTPIEKVEEVKKDKDEGSTKTFDDDLFMSRVNEMNSSPKDIAAAKEWFENSPLSKYIAYEELFNVVNSNAWGEFVNGAIKLYSGSDHTVLYHEAFHGFSQHFMSKSMKVSLYKETAKLDEGKKAIAEMAKKLGVKPAELSTHQKYLAIEELLAEGFRKYMMSNGKDVLGKTPIRNNLFRKILQFLKKIFKGMKYKDLAIDQQIYSIKEVYDKLRVGELNQYTHSETNAIFGNTPLYKTIDPVEGKTTEISDQDAMLLVNSLDSVFVDIVDTQNKARGNTTFTSGVFTNPEKVLEFMYDVAYDTLAQKRDTFNELAAASEGLKKKNFENKVNLLNDALANWGDPSLPEGMVAFHMEKSPFIGDQTKNLDKEAFEKTAEDVANARFDKSGAELSMMELANNEVLYLVKSAREYDKKGDLIKNELGFNKLTDYAVTWKKLINILSDNNTSPRVMQQALEEAKQTEPWVADMLNRLGAVDSKHHSVFDLWTKFWSAFYLSNIGLYQTSINETSETYDEFGEPNEDASFEILVGYASAVFRHVERDFKSYFKTVDDPKGYIKDTKRMGNVLDKSVLEKYRGDLSGNEFNFLVDIGFPLADLKAIREGLVDPNLGLKEGIKFMYQKLDTMMNDYNVPITDVISALRDPFIVKDEVVQVDQETKEEKTFTSISIDKKSESSNINKILSLQARHSGEYANSGVITADGNTKHEQSQPSTLSVMKDAINSVESYRDLIAMPHMAHLRYENNPGVTASIWLKSLFEFNYNTQTFGKKKPGIYLKQDDLTGTQTILDKSHADLDYSVSSANADRYTRLLQDMYAGLIGGRFSTMVHADKGTVLSVYIDSINTGSQSADNHLYIDLKDFGVDNGAPAHDKMFDLLMPHLDATLARIKKVQQHKDDGIDSELLSNISGYTVKDKDGLIRGLDFGIFDTMFTKDTLNAILEAGKVANMSTELLETIAVEMQKHFEWSTRETKSSLGRMMFADEKMQKLISEKVLSEAAVKKGKILDLGTVQDIMLTAYTMNVFLHHAESLTVLYGDVSQFNMKKQDFHKRNAGISATGRMFRTDSDAIDFVNDVLGRPFQESRAEALGLGTTRLFDGTMNTAIFRNNTVDSVLLPEYTKALTDHFVELGATKAKAKARAIDILDAYTNMDEADAQGWISFDSYRIAAKLESRWSPQQEALFMQIVNQPGSVDIAKIVDYFPPRKYQYFGPLVATGVVATAFHKYSLFPLIPSAIKNKNLEVLHDNMMKQDIDYATFDSGSKVARIVAPGANQGDVLYSDLKNRVVAEDVMYTKNTIHLQYLKDQLDINSQYKGKVIFSTQMRKLIETGLIENGVPVDYKPHKTDAERLKAWKALGTKLPYAKGYDAAEKKRRKASSLYVKYKGYENTITKYIEFRKAELIREIGWTEDDLDSGKGNITKLVEFLKKELTRDDTLADHEIDFIKEVNGKFVHDLSISLSANKIERALNAIVNNRIIRQKVNGEALVQLATTMMEPRAATSDENDKYRTNDLRGYSQGADGKTLAMDVKISMQGNFEKLFNLKHTDGKRMAVYIKEPVKNAEGEIVSYTKRLDQDASLIRLNETIQSDEWRAVEGNLELITMVGVRIPVQGLNSMEFMAVWEFLPKQTGNVLIPPSEIVAKSGADFDIDKLTIIMPNIDMINGSPEIAKVFENSNTFDENYDRVSEISTELKILKEQLKDVRADETEEYKALTKNISPEAIIELKELADYFYPAKRKLDKEYSNAQDVITKYQGRDNLNAKQSDALENAWKAIDGGRIEDKKELLQIEYDAWKQDIKGENYQKNLKTFQENQGKKSRNILDKIAKLTREKNGLGSGALENEMMFAVRDILELKQNFVGLITPNSTSLLDGIAEDLSKNRDYSAFVSAHNQNVPTDVISATRLLEPAYNIYKHESNAVGKATLGLGAVDNTFNAIFNRIGAYMNPELKKAQKVTKRATIKLPHNVIEILDGEYKGEYGISLSNIYDADGKKGGNNIADVINQLINGWLDVAKDAWVFDVQGNKQVSPVLLFMIQAGVPLETAIYFVSNPLVKAYVKEQNIVQSAYARAVGEHATEITFYKGKAQANVLNAIGLSTLVKNGVKVIDAKLYDKTLELTKGIDIAKNVRDVASLKLESLGDIKTSPKKKQAIASFLHYLELENLSKGVGELKMKLNYDTSRSTTLFEAQKVEAELKKLEAETAMPVQVIKDIVNESIIGKFRIAPFQLKLWGPLFELRNDENLNEFLINKLAGTSQTKTMQNTYGTEERYVEEFKNDLVVKIFTDQIKAFNINDDTFKGLTVDRESSVEKVKHLNRGATVQPGNDKIYIDKTTLDIQFDNNLFAIDSENNKINQNQMFSYDQLGLAKVDIAAFKYGESKRDEYYKFVMERERLRAINPFEEMSQTHHFLYKLKRNLAVGSSVTDETRVQLEDRIIKATYEQILRDTALDNVLNYWKMFMSDNTVADQLFELKTMHPSLAKNYNIVKDFIVNEGAKKVKGKRVKGQSYTNLALRDNRVEKDMIEVYHNNMLDLSDAGTIILPITEEDTKQDYIEKQRIAKFFSNLPIAAFLQSGLNSTDSLSMVRIMPMDKITNIIEEGMRDVKLDNNYLENFYRIFNTHNSYNNISIRRRLKNYASKRASTVANRKLFSLDVAVDHVLEMNFEDGPLRPMRSEYRGKSLYDLTVSGDVIATTRKEAIGIKSGDIIEIYKDKLTSESEYKTSLLVRATSDEYSIEDIDAEEWSKLEGQTAARHEQLIAKEEGHVQFTYELIDVDEVAVRNNDNIVQIRPENKNELESLIKNNPDTIFVLEGSSDVDSVGYYAEGLGKIANYDKVMPITLRYRLDKKKSSLWTGDNTKDKIAAIKSSLDALEDLYNQDGDNFVFLSSEVGYGSYLMEPVAEGSNEKVDPVAYEYLSTELFNRFGYENKYAKSLDEVQDLMQNAQDIVDFQMDIPYEEIAKVRENLTCK